MSKPIALLAFVLLVMGCSQKPAETKPADPKAAEPKPKVPAGKSEPEMPKELKLLQGKWGGRMESNARLLSQPELTIKDDRITRTFDFRQDGTQFSLVLASSKAQSYQWRISLSPAANPPAIDLFNLDGESKGKSYLGIYSLKENYLELCFNLAGQPRPKGDTFEDRDAIRMSLNRR